MLKLFGIVATLWLLNAIGVDGMLSWVDRTNDVLAKQLDAYQAKRRGPGYRTVEQMADDPEPRKRRRDHDQYPPLQVGRAPKAAKPVKPAPTPTDTSATEPQDAEWL